MAMEIPGLEIFHHLAIADPNSWISSRLQADLPAILATRGAAARRRESCFVGETGDLVTNVLHILAEFANRVVQSEEFTAKLKSQAVLLADEADLDGVAALDEKHLALKSVVEYVGSAALACEAIWREREETKLIATDQRPDYGPHNLSDQTIYTPQVDAADLSTTLNTSDSGDSPSTVFSGPKDNISSNNATLTAPANRTMEQEIAYSQDSELRKRGKGSYLCPHGLGCSKGGVTASGQVKEFQRNSDFRDHMQKHEKPFRCDLPNCPNTTGFARLDQLERHKQKVKHSQVDWTIQQYPSP